MSDYRTYTLREIAEKMRLIFPDLEWVAYNGMVITGFSRDKRPQLVGGQWMHGKKLFTLNLKGHKVKWARAKTRGGAWDYNQAIWGFQDFIEKLTQETHEKDKHTSRKKGVIAYCADGSNIFFETFKECKSFYDLRSVSDVRDAIDNGKPMPDGTTFLDEATDDEFLAQIFKRT